MAHEWDLSKYQIEAAAQALEAVWSAIQKHGKRSPGTMLLQDVRHLLREVKGCYDGAGNLLLMLKSEKTAKGQIAKIVDLCKRVGSLDDLANEHKIALSGVAQFLKRITDGRQLPQEVRILAHCAERVAKRFFAEPQSREFSEKNSAQDLRIQHSPKLSSARYHQMIRFLRQKISQLPFHERACVEQILLSGEQQLRAAKTHKEASCTYKDAVHAIIEKLKGVHDLSEQGKSFKHWLEAHSAVSFET